MYYMPFRAKSQASLILRIGHSMQRPGAECMFLLRQLEMKSHKRKSWREWYKLPSTRRLYDPETFARVVDEKVQKMHEEWLQKREAYARAVERGEMTGGDKGGT